MILAQADQTLDRVREWWGQGSLSAQGCGSSKKPVPARVKKTKRYFAPLNNTQ